MTLIEVRAEHDVENSHTEHLRRFAEYCRAVEAVAGYAGTFGCPAFDRVVDIPWYRAYFEKQTNMALVEDTQLPPGVLGVVFKKEHSNRGQLRALFLVMIAPMIDQISKQFTIAHELGHVLLHGRLMHAGMLLPQRTTSWHHEDHDHHWLAEVEANIYALLSVIPTSLIEGLETQLDSTLVALLQQVASEVHGCAIPESLIRERLLIHDVLYASDRPNTLLRSQAEFRRLLDQEASWTCDGARRKWYEETSSRFEDARQDHGRPIHIRNLESIQT